MAGTIFERLAARRPVPAKKQEISPAQRLLDFLQRWPKDTVSARNIYQFGPQSTKKRQVALATIDVLVKHGWLAPIQSRRRDGHDWRIIRRATVNPTVEQ
jgi:hypothetical protein